MNPVVIDFIIRGMPDINRAMRSVEQAAARAEQATTKAAQRESQNRKKAAENEAKAKIKAMMKADRWRQQAQDKAERETQRSANKRVRDEEKAMRALIREAEKTGNARLRISQRVDREFKRMQDRRAKENERHEREATRIHEREARAQSRADWIKSRDEMRNRRRFAGAVGMYGARGLARGAGIVKGYASQTAGMIGQLGGGFSIADSVQRNTQNAGATADLLNAGVNKFSAVAGNSKKRDRAEIEGVLDSSTTQYGMERGDAIAGLRSFTSTTGDLETATKLLPQLAQLSRATGASLEDMTAAAGKAGLAFGDMSDSSKKAERIMQVMRVVAGQGKAGSVEAKDMATQMGKLVATAGKFEGDNVENLAKMGMLAQFAAGGGGAWSAQSASTAVTRFGDVFGKPARAKAFDEAGIQVFADKGRQKLRAPEQIIADAFEKTKGDQVKLGSLFGSSMGMRSINQFGSVFEKGYKGADGTQYKGREAIVQYAKAMTGTTMSKGEVAGAASERMQEADAKMARVREDFDKAVREKVIPALLKMVPEFEKFVPMFVDLNSKALPAFVDLLKTVGAFVDAHKDLINNIAEHPIGTILAAEVMKSMGQAAIGQIVANAIQKGFGDAGMGQVMGKALSSSIGKAGMTVAAAAIAVEMGMIAIDNEYKKEEELRSQGRTDQVEAAQLTARVQRGTATPEERAEAAKLVAKLQTDRSQVEAAQNDPSVVRRIGKGLSGLTADGRQAQKDEEANQAQQLANLDKTLRDLQDALKMNTEATKQDSASTSSGPNGDARHKSLTQRSAQ